MNESLTATDFMRKWEEAMRIRGFNQKVESDNAFMEKWIRAVKNINKFYTEEQADGLGRNLAAHKDGLIKKLANSYQTVRRHSEIDIEKTDKEDGEDGSQSGDGDGLSEPGDIELGEVFQPDFQV